MHSSAALPKNKDKVSESKLRNLLRYVEQELRELHVQNNIATETTQNSVTLR